MQKYFDGPFIVVVCLIFIGCGAAVKEIRQKTQNERADVFSEINNTDSSARNFAVLTIKATIKTHLEEYYPLESKYSQHGKPGYPFLINIDGQAETWKVDGQKESLALYDKDGKVSHNPDAGEGIKYILEKRIKLSDGYHKLFFGLPSDDYFKEVEITLTKGDFATLEFKPIYNPQTLTRKLKSIGKYKTLSARIPTFKRGIKDMEIYLNGTRL